MFTKAKTYFYGLFIWVLVVNEPQSFASWQPVKINTCLKRQLSFSANFLCKENWMSVYFYIKSILFANVFCHMDILISCKHFTVEGTYYCFLYHICVNFQLNWNKNVFVDTKNGNIFSIFHIIILKNTGSYHYFLNSIHVFTLCRHTCILLFKDQSTFTYYV